MTPANLETIYRDTGKPDRAVPVTTECASPGAFPKGEVTASPTPTASTKGSMNTNGKNGNAMNERIEALREKEKQIRAAIAAETVKRKKREFREFERLKNIIGGALLANAADDAVFSAHLKERLQKAVVAESERVFLRGKGWL